MKKVVYSNKLILSGEGGVPVPAAGEALVRVTMAGICNTDMEIIKGYMGFSGTLGHEFAGVVESVAAGTDSRLTGRRVVGEINCGCGKCRWCAAGMERHCPSRTVLGIYKRDGCMAEYLTLPVANLIPIADNVNDENAVFCEPLAAAFEILEQVHMAPGSRVAVLGDGKLGILCAIALRSCGAEVTLAGRHGEKMATARKFGIECVESSNLSEPSFDFVVEATGRASGIGQAMRIVRPRGTIILKSTVADTEKLDLAPLVINEITVVGSRCGRFAPAMRALASGLDLTPLVSGIYSLDDAVTAFERARENGVLKILIKIR